MKITSAILTSLCLFTLSCNKETPVNPSSATSATTTTSTTATAASFATSTVAPPPPNTLRVVFEGLVTQMMDPALDLRAVVPDAPGHPRQIEFPTTYQNDLEKALGKAMVSCSVRCVVRIDGMAFRIVGANGQPGSAFDPNDFKGITHLKTLPGLGTEFDQGNLKDDIWKTPPPKGSDIAGVFELAGGTGNVVPFVCLYRFIGESAFHTFPHVVTVDFPTTGAQLQIFKDGDADWSKLIDLSGALTIHVNNNNNGATGSMHFMNYRNLSKTPPNIPNIEKEDPKCHEPLNDTAGCSDSQWP